MDCFCGCGRRVERRDVKVTLQAGRIALELMAWDKARAAGDLGAPPEAHLEGLIERGGECYGRLIRSLHGEREVYDFEEGERWIASSEAERLERPEMTKKGGFFGRDRVQLRADELEALDRAHPELSFSAAAKQDRPQDTVDRLERLAELHGKGALTDAEFAAAKSRVMSGEG
jgi:hypothetical protein